MNENVANSGESSQAETRKFETFSYLPPMEKSQIRQQIEYIVAQNWDPAFEYCDPVHSTDIYWKMWKLPLFGETDVENILREAEACRAANPGGMVRLIGYDPIAQHPGTAMVIYQ